MKTYTPEYTIISGKRTDVFMDDDPYGGWVKLEDAQSELKALSIKYSDLALENEKLENDSNRLKMFADEMLEAAFNALDIDGADIQEIGVNSGILEEKLLLGFCEEDCACANSGVDLPVLCYKKQYKPIEE